MCNLIHATNFFYKTIYDKLSSPDRDRQITLTSWQRKSIYNIVEKPDLSIGSVEVFSQTALAFGALMYWYIVHLSVCASICQYLLS